MWVNCFGSIVSFKKMGKGQLEIFQKMFLNQCALPTQASNVGFGPSPLGHSGKKDIKVKWINVGALNSKKL